MTATHGVSRIRTRTAAVAGIVTAGAAALSLVHAPGAAADAHTSAVAPTTMSSSAPAFTPPAGQGTTDQAPEAGDSAAAGSGDTGSAAAAADTAEAPAAKPAAAAADTAEAPAAKPAAAAADTAAQAPQKKSAPADKGRGAQYNADGTLVTIDRKEQPKPKPASDEQIDQWINEALDVMKAHGIPGSYDGIKSNLMRESSGDPHTINMWDSNAHKNIPSKGLLQVIDPTFEQYHVDGTSKDVYDPVANIAAACNYAADRYGSMDNVNSAY
ncbi:transglycosylase SLT domain-containing protein [Streptomyces sp. NRRL F-2890]|uniref:transglycosylase SLT domain-containing protein n=1 Tax=Streptomyces sp. NRRL F-2890 TaxID=1463845 RepID=UPI0004C5DC81|nr:transglycosylase SLT domain-containing protein [Streptomyces sp. NRRL F-2890]